MVFTPATNGNGTGYASFTFQVQDDGGTANGGQDTDQTARTMTINVTWVNQAPQGANNTVPYNETTGLYTFLTGDFGFSDPHDSPANALKAVEITTLPTAGTLADNGVAVTAGQFVPATDIAAGDLVYTASPTTLTLNSPGLQSNLEGDSLSLALSATDSASNTLTFGASNLPAGLSIDSSTGDITGTINSSAAAAGPYLVTLYVSDATADIAAAQQITWMVNPVKVFLANPGSQTSLDGDTVGLPVTATDSASHTLSFAAIGLPSGLSIDSATGDITGTIAGAGASLVTITATDSTAGVSSKVSFAWAVYASAPSTGNVSLTNPGTQDSFDGGTVSLAVSASDSASNPLSFAAIGLPSGLSINASSGAITGTVASGADTSSPYLVSITATDTVTSDIAKQYLAWTVEPAPVFVNLTNPTVLENYDSKAASLTLSATDSASHTLTYTVSGLPSGLTLSGNTISGTLGASADTSSPYLITITAADSTSGVSNTQTFVWIVKPADADSFTFQVQDDGGTAHGGHDTDATARTMHIAPPIAANDAGFTTTQDTPVTIAGSTLLANDTDPGNNLLTITDFTQPQNGSVTYDGSNFVYTPNASFSGADQFSYTVNDGHGGAATATVFLDVNPLPVAHDDWFYPVPDLTTPIDVLANDTDGGMALTIESAGTPAARNGKVAGDGSILDYTPTSGYHRPGQLQLHRHRPQRQHRDGYRLHHGRQRPMGHQRG